MGLPANSSGEGPGVSEDGDESNSYEIPNPYDGAQRSLCNKCHSKDEFDRSLRRNSSLVIAQQRMVVQLGISIHHNLADFGPRGL